MAYFIYLFGKRKENTSMLCFKNSAAVCKTNYVVLWDYPDSTVSEGRLIATKLQFQGVCDSSDKTRKKPKISPYVTCEFAGGLDLLD